MEIDKNNPSKIERLDERRIRSGAFMALAVLVAANVPTPVFAFTLLMSAGLLGFLEWSELCFGQALGKRHPFIILAVTCGLFRWPGGWLASISDGALNFTVMLAWSLACCAGVVLAALRGGSSGERYRQIMQAGWLGGLVSSATFLIGVVIQFAAWECMIATHERSAGEWLFWVCLVALVDSAGYLVGKSVASKQGVLSMSPKKTVAGTVAMIAVPFLGFFWLWAKPPLTYAVLVGVVALWGDLWLSLVKRVRDVKDTGQIIPGHGGALDRLDSHLMVWACLGLLAKLSSV